MPDAVFVPFSMTVGLLQVSEAGGAMATFGGVISCDTVAVDELVQPLALFVMVTVYIPGAFTVILLMLLPEEIPAPAHA